MNSGENAFDSASGDFGKYEERLEEDMKKVNEDDAEKVVNEGTEKADRLLNSKVDFVVRAAKQFKLVYMMIRDWLAGEYEAPWRTIAALVSATMYFLMPLDIVPDLIPVFGWVDDAAVMLTAIILTHKDVLDYCKAKGIDPEDFGISI